MTRTPLAGAPGAGGAPAGKSAAAAAGSGAPGAAAGGRRHGRCRCAQRRRRRWLGKRGGHGRNGWLDGSGPRHRRAERRLRGESLCLAGRRQLERRQSSGRLLFGAKRAGHGDECQSEKEWSEKGSHAAAHCTTSSAWRRAGGLDCLQDGDDVGRLEPDPVEAVDQRLQVGAADESDMTAAFAAPTRRCAERRRSRPWRSASGCDTCGASVMRTVRLPWVSATCETWTFAPITTVPVCSSMTTRAGESGVTMRLPTSARKRGTLIVSRLLEEDIAHVALERDRVAVRLLGELVDRGRRSWWRWRSRGCGVPEPAAGRRGERRGPRARPARRWGCGHRSATPCADRFRLPRRRRSRRRRSSPCATA